MCSTNAEPESRDGVRANVPNAPCWRGWIAAACIVSVIIAVVFTWITASDSKPLTEALTGGSVLSAWVFTIGVVLVVAHVLGVVACGCGPVLGPKQIAGALAGVIGLLGFDMGYITLANNTRNSYLEVRLAELVELDSCNDQHRVCKTPHCEILDIRRRQKELFRTEWKAMETSHIAVFIAVLMVLFWLAMAQLRGRNYAGFGLLAIVWVLAFVVWSSHLPGKLADYCSFDQHVCSAADNDASKD